MSHDALKVPPIDESLTLSETVAAAAVMFFTDQGILVSIILVLPDDGEILAETVTLFPEVCMLALLPSESMISPASLAAISAPMYF